MTWFEVIFLGLVQGLTEFLPVSSSGHLAIFKNIFGLEEAGLTYDILLHLGTLAAVFICYYKDIWKLICAACSMLVDFCRNVAVVARNIKNDDDVPLRRVVNTSYKKFTVLIIVSTIPTGIIGIVFGDLIELAGTSLLVPGICLIITGILLRISDNLDEGYKSPKTTTWKDAGIIGIAQGIATLPGISRSGTTIFACLACGLKREYAVKYSFIVSIPAILGAGILDIKDLSSEAVPASEIWMYVVGAVIAGAVGFACIKWMLKIVSSRKFKYFSYYCLIIGAISVIAFFFV